MTLNQILAILRARWLAALLGFGIVFGGIVGVTLWLPKQYTASATVLMDIKNADPLSGQNFGGVMPISYMITQVDVIKSGRVAQQVIDRLRLRESPELRSQYETTAKDTTTFESWLVELLRLRLDVRPTKDSGALDIKYTSPSPSFAAALANAFAEAYIATNVQLRNEPARQFGTFFDTQAKAARDAYEVAQGKLSAFQQKHGLIATEERFDVETSRLQELSSQQLALQALAAESRNRDLQARSKGTNTQEVLNNALVSGLTGDLSRQQAKLEEIAERLGASHPSLIEARLSIEELKRRIADETRRVTCSVAINNDVNQGRLGAVSASVADQRAKVLRLKALRDEAAVLEREVEGTKLSYQNLMQRQAQLSLESQTDRSSISLLEAATPPAKPSSPRVFLNAAIALVLGFIIAMASALLREWRDRRFRTLDDAHEVLKIRVLGVLPKTTQAALAREPLAAGLVRMQGAR